MPPTARGESRVVIDGALDRGEHPRPVPVQLPVGDSQYAIPAQRQREVALVVVLPGTRLRT